MPGKTGLQSDPLDKFTGGGEQPAEAPARSAERRASKVSKVSKESQLRKLANLDMRPVRKFDNYDTMMARLRPDQIARLHEMAVTMNTKRPAGVKKERITPNMLLRAAVDAFTNAIQFDENDIRTEDQLIKRVVTAAGRKK